MELAYDSANGLVRLLIFPFFWLRPNHKLYFFMPAEPDFARILPIYLASAIALAIAVIVLLQLRPQVRHRLLIFGAALGAGVYGFISWLR